jgi:hypothetical protein
MNTKVFYDSSDSYRVNVRAPLSLTANRIIIWPDASGEILLNTSTQTLTNKTLTTPIIDGVTYSVNNNRQIITEVVAINGTTVHAATLALKTFEAAAIILRVIVNITTKSTGASTLDIGYTPASATTSSDTLLDGIDSGTAEAIFDSGDASLDTQANTKAQLAAAGGFITIDDKTGDSTGLVGVAYIQYILV